MTTTPHRYGWKPSLTDINDQEADLRELTELAEVDPRQAMSPCYDQGNLGSCTANAIAGALEYDESLTLDTAVATPSRLFIYYCERVREGSVSTDSGAWGRDGFKSLRKTGAPPEDIWPYDISQFTTKPSEEAYLEAAHHKIGGYTHPGLGHDVTWEERRDAFKKVLSNRQTIAFGFTVYESFESSNWVDGEMPMPQKGEGVLGGHEVLLVGYLQGYPNHALVRNSWGTGWQMDGYFLMPWNFLCNPNYASDWRSIYRPKGA
jgi:C1A family cysteine protease